MSKTLLPGGCWVSELTVLPANWKTSRKSIKEEWRLCYRFYDPGVKDSEGRVKPKQVQIKRMNSFQEWEVRKEATEELIKAEWDLLKRLGYNPHTRTAVSSLALSESSPLLSSLYKALEKMEVINRVRRETEGYLRYIGAGLKALGMDTLPLKSVEPKTVVQVLEYVKEHRPALYTELKTQGEEVLPPKAFTPATYNRYRKALQSLFKVLKGGLHLVKINPVQDVRKQKQVRKLRKLLTPEERKRVKDHLYTYHRDFYLFVQVFFSSGCRETELLSVKAKDVSLKQQVFRCLVRKRQEGPVEVERVITDGTLPFWQDVLRQCEPEMYLFSHEFKPGYSLQDANHVNKWWRRIVKKGLGINVDFYAFKYSFATEARAILTAREVAEQMGHTDESMVNEIYDVEALLREQKKIKKVTTTL